MGPSMATSNLTPAQIIEQKAEKFDKRVEKERDEKLKAAALALRGVEVASGGVVALSMSALETYKPEWFTYEIPRIVGMLTGMGAFVLAGKSNLMREVGAGTFMASFFPLAGLGGKKLVEYAQAA